MSLLGHCWNSDIVALDLENNLLKCNTQLVTFISELRKANISRARSACLSVKQFGHQLDSFHDILRRGVLLKSATELRFR
jgi:hypothetical protein